MIEKDMRDIAVNIIRIYFQKKLKSKLKIKIKIKMKLMLLI